MRMATTLLKTPVPADALQSDLASLRSQWRSLTELIEAFAPTVVVLIARKTPRLFEAFGMNVAGNPLVITDLAIPMCGRYLADARVAIVDDMVNVGSTIHRTARIVQAAGAREVEMFAIARLDPNMHDGDCSSHSQAGREPRYAEAQLLDRMELMEFAARVPEALQGLAKPYDMDFPLVQCRLEAPFHGFEELALLFADRYGEDRVYDVSTPRGHAAGVRRLVLDLTAESDINSKVRLYFDESAQRCNVVPMRVAPTLDGDPQISGGWPAAVWSTMLPELERPTGHDTSPLLEHAKRDARARLRLFSESLASGLEFMAANRDVLRGKQEAPFCLDEAQLTLGPLIRRVTRRGVNAFQESAAAIGLPPADRLAVSPFVAALRDAGLIRHLSERSPAHDSLTLFIALFELIADAVGVNNPSQYRLDWPYTRQQVLDNPYLRLRIGPTVADIVAVICEASGEQKDPQEVRWAVRRLLDRFIDFGSVVPTTAEYDGHLYRIYRKGERSPRVAPSDRLLNAWRSYGEPLSLTRVSKLATFLAFSSPTDSAVVIRAETRGNTLCFAPSVLHSETEVGHYLRNTGQIKPAK
jgi:hypothetical protein